MPCDNYLSKTTSIRLAQLFCKQYSACRLRKSVAERRGLCCRATRTLSKFSGMRTDHGRPRFFFGKTEAVDLTWLTQFKMVWHVGTLPFLPMLKCFLNLCCVWVAESLFLKKLSTANAWRSHDQCSMATYRLWTIDTAETISALSTGICVWHQFQIV
jgi:hypothetical protein